MCPRSILKSKETSFLEALNTPFLIFQCSISVGYIPEAVIVSSANRHSPPAVTCGWRSRCPDKIQGPTNGIPLPASLFPSLSSLLYFSLFIHSLIHSIIPQIFIVSQWWSKHCPTVMDETDTIPSFMMLAF